MSFVPAPQQANAAVNAVVPVAPAAMAAPAATETSDADLLFKIRTFDVYWVEKYALMYKDGIAKVRYLILIFSYESRKAYAKPFNSSIFSYSYSPYLLDF